MLPGLHTDFSRGRSGGLVLPSLSEFSTVYCDPHSQRLVSTVIFQKAVGFTGLTSLAVSVCSITSLPRTRGLVLLLTLLGGRSASLGVSFFLEESLYYCVTKSSPWNCFRCMPQISESRASVSFVSGCFLIFFSASSLTHVLFGFYFSSMLFSLHIFFFLFVSVIDF